MRIKIPYLPISKVKCVLVDANAPAQLFGYFDYNKIKYIKTLSIKNTIDAVSTHPDMQLCNLDEGLFICEPTTYEYYNNQFEIFGVNVTSGEKIVGCNYPEDVAYNVVVAGDYLLHNVSYTDTKLLNCARSLNLGILDTKQGYTMCATCIIDKNAIITDDKGIHNVCQKHGIDSLLIERDVIILGDRKDGFLGGCCGMVGYKKLLFCGDVKRHKSYEDIKRFASKYSVELISAYGGPLTDIGSIIPIVQE